jgi:hypothetical protein
VNWNDPKFLAPVVALLSLAVFVRPTLACYAPRCELHQQENNPSTSTICGIKRLGKTASKKTSCVVRDGTMCHLHSKPCVIEKDESPGEKLHHIRQEVELLLDFCQRYLF